MRMIQLHKINSRRVSSWDEPAHADNSPFVDTDDVGENPTAQAVVTAPSAPPAVNTAPVCINVDAIRCFYPRHADRGPGTRITFTDGGGFAVSELYDDVLVKVLSV